MNQLKTNMLKYGLLTSIKNVSPFYITIAVLLVIGLLLKNMAIVGNMNLGAWDLLIAFVATGIVSGFRERFYLFLQNGFSRKSLFVHFILCMLILTVLMAGIGVLIDLFCSIVDIKYNPIFKDFYGLRYSVNGLSYYLESFLWSSCMNFVFVSIALLIMVSFYRLSKFWKIIIFMIIPTIFICIFPFLDFLLFDGAMLIEIVTLFVKLLGLFTYANPYMAVLTTSCLSVIALIASFMILRKLDVKK